jgi:hypothetical protein
LRMDSLIAVCHIFNLFPFTLGQEWPDSKGTVSESREFPFAGQEMI